ncbi:MAG: hypothetical protein ACR2J9_09945 [Gaiellales bacterium]
MTIDFNEPTGPPTTVPALAFDDVKRLTVRSGGPTRGYPDLPKVMTPLFFDHVDLSQPVAILRTHVESTADWSGEPIEVLVAICSFAPAGPGPRLINELLCLPDDYAGAVTTMELPALTVGERDRLKLWGMCAPGSAS